MATLQRPWYSYARIDNFGQIDPQGAYWKPDSNILTPPGYPITALLPGMVTSTQRTGWGQTVVTIRLNSPINRLATHTFYEHMHDATVHTGQRVQAGDLIGHANYSGEGAALGFGLYSGDIYGSGPAWNILQNDLKPGGAGLLKPVSLLNAAASRSGGTPTIVNDSSSFPFGSDGSGGGQDQGDPTYTPLLDQVHETLINTPGFYGIALALDEAEEFPGWIDLTNPLEWDIAGAKLQAPDIVGFGRSVGASITDNFVPFAVRSGLALAGFILVLALLLKVLAAPIGSANRIIPELLA